MSHREWTPSRLPRTGSSRPTRRERDRTPEKESEGPEVPGGVVGGCCGWSSDATCPRDGPQPPSRHSSFLPRVGKHPQYQVLVVHCSSPIPDSHPYVHTETLLGTDTTRGGWTLLLDSHTPPQVFCGQRLSPLLRPSLRPFSFSAPSDTVPRETRGLGGRDPLLGKDRPTSPTVPRDTRVPRGRDPLVLYGVSEGSGRSVDPTTWVESARNRRSSRPNYHYLDQDAKGHPTLHSVSFGVRRSSCRV